MEPEQVIPESVKMIRVDTRDFHWFLSRADMHKIDVHRQIEMNINIIVDILYKEFKLDKKYEDSSNI